MDLEWLNHPLKNPDEAARTAALRRQSQLTKPPGGLGELEKVAVFLAAAQGRERPRIDSIWISIYAGDHGVVEEGVSAFPQAVTAEMVKNFARGGAAISVLARQLDARLEVIDLGTVSGLAGVPGVEHLGLGPGAANSTLGPAMSAEQCARAMAAGRRSVERACREGADLFIGGEMGIGNTTAAAALGCALLDESPECLAGPGTGLDPAGVARKAEVIGRALARHRAHCATPLEVLRRLGGFEIAALAGAYLACAQAGLAVLVDGFIATSAALTAERFRPGTARWFLYGHGSAEPGHARLLAALGARPLLSLDMRLGEGSGAAVAVPLLRLACALHDGMATFAEAAVSEKL
jgi:nicotinate-nucleotide--dimethylbenzimidazole phosphoribosyltransferase